MLELPLLHLWRARFSLGDPAFLSEKWCAAPMPATPVSVVVAARQAEADRLRRSQLKQSSVSHKAEKRLARISPYEARHWAVQLKPVMLSNLIPVPELRGGALRNTTLQERILRVYAKSMH